MNLENMLCKINQTQRAKYSMILSTWGMQNRQIHRDRNQNRGYQELGEGGNGNSVFNGYRVSVSDDLKVLKLDSGDGFTTIANALNTLNGTVKQ